MSGYILIELLGHPKGKGRPRMTKTGIAYTPKETRDYEGTLRVQAMRIMQGQSRNPFQGALRVQVTAHMAIPRSWAKWLQGAAKDGLVHPTTRPDADNIVKMLDGLNGVVWRDDAQIVDVRVLKLYSERPRLVVEVTEIAEQRRAE